MARISVLFAIASAVFILLGLLVPLRPQVSIHGGNVVIGLDGRVCCFMFAAFLCCFAAAYSLGILPMNLSAAYWHLWITALSVVAFAIFVASAENAARANTPWLWTALISELVSGLAFAAGMAVFLINLTQAIYKLAHHGVSVRLT